MNPQMTNPWSMPLPELAHGDELAGHELPLHAEGGIGSLPPSHDSSSEWLQRGTKLECITCPDKHGLFLQPRQMYTGKVGAKGEPILTNRW